MKNLKLEPSEKNYYKTVCNSFLKQLPAFLLIILILFQPISSVYAQRISSGCTSNNSLDVQVEGIHNKNGTIGIKGLSNKVKNVTVECTCRGRVYDEDPATSCPSAIVLTVNGQNISVPRSTVKKYSTWWGIDAGHPEGDFYVYRLVQNTTVTTLKYNAPSSATERRGMRGLTAWIVNNDAAKANQPQSLNIDEFHFRHPARCFNIPIKLTNAARDITIYLPVSEIQNNPARFTQYSATALNANGTVLASIPIKTFNQNNNADEIRLDKLSFNNVPANATAIKVCIESPKTPAGTSFMIGSIAVTSNQKKPTLTCPAGGTVACAKDINPGTATYKPACPDDNRKPTVSNPAINGEPNCPGTTYTFTHSVAGLSCKQVFKIGYSEAGAFTCPPKVKVHCEADIEPVFPEYAINCNTKVTEVISEPVVHGKPGCPGTIYTYKYTLTDACGRTTSCEQVFQIENNTGPTIGNHGNVQVHCESDIVPVFPDYTIACGEDGLENIEGPDVEGSQGCPGTTYTYIYTITDNCGRSASCIQVFTIAENDALTIACNSNIQVVCESEIKLDFPEYDDNCNGSAIESVCGPVIEGVKGEAGTTYTYMYTVTDNCGRSASCEQVFEIGYGCDASNYEDWLALKKIYEETGGEYWPFQKGWEQIKGDAPPPNCDLSNMQGVTLDRKTKRVIELYLFGLKGNFPTAIGDLSALEYLTFIGVDFMGSSIPSEIGKLKNLKELILADSNIGGQLPAELATLSNLTLLTINDNEISGSYPPEYEVFCNQLTHHRFQCNASISDGNNFDIAWEEFCTAGVCKNYKRANFNDYTIQPNPSTGLVLVKFQKEAKGIRTINVYDNSGKQYESISYKGVENSVELDLRELPKGIYIVELNDGDYLNTQKIIIQ